MSDSLAKDSRAADSLLKDTILSGLREMAADSAGHVPDSVRERLPHRIASERWSQTAYRQIRWRKTPLR